MCKWTAYHYHRLGLYCIHLMKTDHFLAFREDKGKAFGEEVCKSNFPFIFLM